MARSLILIGRDSTEKAKRPGGINGTVESIPTDYPQISGIFRISRMIRGNSPG